MLVKARTDRFVSPEELAHRLVIATQMVAAFERGARRLDFVATREGCQALGVAFLDFMVRLDREITAQLPDAFTTPAPAADTNAADHPYGIAHHVLPHVPPAPSADAPAAEQTEGGAQ